jgi:hypothetical protein
MAFLRLMIKFNTLLNRQNFSESNSNKILIRRWYSRRQSPINLVFKEPL